MTYNTLEGGSVSAELELFEVKPGKRFPLARLKEILPDVETVLFFGKVYELTAQQLGALLLAVLDTKLARALLADNGQHSHHLQDYLLDPTMVLPDVDKGQLSFPLRAPKGEILPHLWEQLEVDVANSIKEVADKLHNVMGMLPGKEGRMHFQSLMAVNARRPIIGDYRAQIAHDPVKDNLLILDVSGSMSQPKVEEIIDDVVALSYKANAHLAIVSNSTTHWEPGAYGTDDVLAKAQYGGTHYETLAPLFDRDWGVVVTVADYDSSRAAQPALLARKGVVDEVLDVSLVDRPTFLAECVGVRAKRVRPILMASRNLTRDW